MATADQLKQGGNAAKLGAMSPPPIARGFAPASGNSSTPNPGAARPHPVGKITGKGTGTSDQVPINASNGEFIIKAAAVKKIGLETLEALNSIADGDPEGKAESQAEGLGQSEPRGFKCGGAVRKMATGGLVEDPKANNFGDAAAGSQNSQVKVIPSATPSQPAENSSSAITPSTPAASPPIQATGTPPRPSPGTPGGENFGGATAQMYQRMSAELNPPAATSQPVVKPSAPTPIAPIQRASTGADPLAGQYGHAAIGAPIDQGAAMDRKMLAQSSDASRMPAFDSGSTAFYQPKLGAVRGFATGGLVAEPKKNSFGDEAAASLDARVSQIPATRGAFPPPAPSGQSNIGATPPDPVTGGIANTSTPTSPALTGVRGLQARQSGVQTGGATGSWDSALQSTAPAPDAGMGSPKTPAQMATPKNAGNVVAPGTPEALTQSAARPGELSAAQGQRGALPQTGNQVTRVGNSYSGGPNIKGDIELAGNRGGMISAQDNQAAENLARKYGQTTGFGPAGEISGGGQVSSINTSAGYAADLRQLAGIEAEKSKSAANMRDQENYAAMKAGHISPKAYQATLTANQVDQTARRAQDIQSQGQQLVAGSAKYTADAHVKAQQATNGIAQRKLGIEEQKAATEQAKNAQLAKLDDLIINGNPLQKKMAAGQKAAIMGKGQDSFVDGKPLNDTQAKALLFGSRMQASGETLDSMAADGVNQPGVTKRIADSIGMGVAANFTQSDKQQQVEQAQRDFINASLRRESGAAIAESEFDNAKKQYFVQPGDSEAVIEQKRKNRMLGTHGILAEVPDSETRVSQIRGTQQQPAATSNKQPTLSNW